LSSRWKILSARISGSRHDLSLKRENRQPTKALRKQAHFGIREICIFNGHSGSLEDWYFYMPASTKYGALYGVLTMLLG
jgi:hypothetical protein